MVIDYTKRFIKNWIKAYEKYLKMLEETDPGNEAAKIVWIIFGMKEALELYDTDKIEELIDGAREAYLKFDDMFVCGKAEWWVSVMRIMDNDAGFCDNLQVLINYTNES